MEIPSQNLFGDFVPGVTKTTVVCGKEDKQDDRKPRLRRLLSVPNLLSSRRSTKMPVVVNDPPRPRKQDPDGLVIRPADSARFTPVLPTELWIQILRFAAGSTLHLPSSAVSFLDHPTPHAKLASRLSKYRENVKFRSSLTKVCRAWNLIGQEILYEFIWLSKASEGRWLAGRLCGDLGLPIITSTVSVVSSSSPKSSRHASKSSPSTKPPASTGPSVLQRIKRGQSIGRYIRRLHVETLTMDRCSPHDMLLILQHCPLLKIFADHRSIRRPMHPLIFSSSNVVAPFSSGVSTPPVSPHAPMNSSAVISALLSGPSQLTHLSYTHYSYDPADFDGGVSFYTGVIAPGLEQVGEGIQFLEVSLNSASTGMHGDGQGDAWSVGPSLLSQEQARFPPLPRQLPSATPLGANWLTELRGDFTSTSICSSDSITTSPSLSFSPPPLVLPALRTLKATLDNATFYVLSTWSMPRLSNLSIISADFNYTGRGFQHFFEVHGHKIVQLELGHSSADIEEYWLTDPPPRARNDVALTTLATYSASTSPGSSGTHSSPSSTPLPPLAAWTPNLKEFICSADAEWNWQSPDWISPHVLLPSHPGVVLIAVRDVDNRLFDDLEMWERRKWEQTSDGVSGGEQTQDGPFFVLLEQFSSLFRKVSFPSLRYVRDLSQSSDDMRRFVPSTRNATAFGSSDVPESAHPSHSPGRNGFTSNPPPSSSSASTSVKARASTHGLRHLFSSPSSPPGPSATRSPVPLRQPPILSPFARPLSPSAPSDLPPQVRRELVHRFWRAVLVKCRERGIWFQDWRGQTLAFGDILRAETTT